MTARQPFDPSAGVWIGFYAWVRPHDGATRKSYLRRNDDVTSWTVAPSDALRFDTKAEAVKTVRGLVGRHPGQTTGAERVS